MLYNRRLQLKQLAVREAAGESFWTEEFDSPVRQKLLFQMNVVGGVRGRVSEYARSLIMLDEGLSTLAGMADPLYDLEAYVQRADDKMIPSVIEAWWLALQQLGFNTPPFLQGFQTNVNTILREYRISFELNQGEMIPFSSLELHAEVVAPALVLLASGPEWNKVETKFRDALAEIANGSPDDAITDAGAALQEALVLLGCDGNALGPLIKSAKKKHLFAKHDGRLLDGIEDIAEWVSADRSTLGDAHHTSVATNDDAWLTVHVVGALLLRLSKSPSRGA